MLTGKNSLGPQGDVQGRVRSSELELMGRGPDTLAAHPARSALEHGHHRSGVCRTHSPLSSSWSPLMALSTIAALGAVVASVVAFMTIRKVRQARKVFYFHDEA
jgi:hypothetical protein